MIETLRIFGGIVIVIIMYIAVLATIALLIAIAGLFGQWITGRKK